MSAAVPADDPALVALATDRLASVLVADEQAPVKLDSYVYQGPVMHCDRYIYLPQTILDQFDRLECKSFSGILPEINRVYITVDNRLILFNYMDGSIYAYEDFSQIIISVALVTPKPDVFIDEIEHLLVVATPAEIVILGVRFDGGPEAGSIELVETSYYACSDGIHMLKIVCTPPPSSRIFAAGKDGRIYEIDYQPGTRWFSKKCRKLSHTTLMDKVSVLFPVLKLFQSQDALVDLVVDPYKANLYGLTQGSSIYKYDLGSDKFDQCQGPFAIAASQLKQSLHLDPDPDFAIVSLSVDHGNINADICAITNHGHRIFLKCSTSGSFEVESVRICPRYIDAPSVGALREKYKPFYSKGQSPCAIRSAVCLEGTVLAADMRDPRCDTLVSMSLVEYGEKRSITSPPPTSSSTTQSVVVADENVESHLLDCRVHDIKASPREIQLQEAPLAATLYRNAAATSPLVGLSLAAVQHALPAPKFIVLTASRVMFYALSRPLEQLTQLLSSSCPVATFQSTMAKFGMAESCAILLIIICSSTTSSMSSRDKTHTKSPAPYTVQNRRIERQSEELSGTVFAQSQAVRQAAIDAFMMFGGEPSLKINALDNNVSFSYGHNALYMFASRILRSVWFKSLVTSSQRELVFRLPQYLLGSVLRPLVQLQRFINEYQLPQTRAFQSHDSAAGTVELNSLTSLEKLIARSIEVLSLITLIYQCDCLSSMLQILDSSDRFALETNSFKEIVTLSQGSKCIRSLIRSFLEVEGSGGSSHIATLQSSCPSYIDATDLYLFNGNQLLLQTRNQTVEGKTVKLQREAIDYFKKACSNVEFPLPIVVSKLMERGLLSDIVELCLYRASALDRSVSSSSSSNEDDRIRRQTIQMRQKTAYQTICSCLEEAISHPSLAISALQLNAALTICFHSTSPSFLEDFFFPFYVQRLNTSYDVECDAFQSYLIKRHQFDRLRQYFITLRKFLAGARFFGQLPYNLEMTGNHATIRDRIRFLEIGIELSRYCTTQDDSLIFELRKSIELGEIQSQMITNLVGEKERRGEEGLVSSAAADIDLSACLSGLLNGEALYSIACKHGLYEICLRILFVEDSRQHSDVIAALYANIISSVIQEREALNADWRPAVKDAIARLGRQYRLTAFMFPCSSICELLEQYNLTRAGSVEEATPSFVGPLLVDQVQFPVDQLIGIYSHLVRHWSLSRLPLYTSILYIISPFNIDALSDNALLFQRTVSSAVALCDLCLSLRDNPMTEQFNRLRQSLLQKKLSSS